MKEISCQVINDLLPLYIDQVLSDESSMLVEEHLATCQKCKNLSENMENTEIPNIKENSAEATEAIKKIKKRINLKKAGAIGLTISILLMLTFGLYYLLFVKQTYLPYEETGLTVENDVLHTNEPFYCYYEFDSPEEGVLFVYLTTTVHETNTKHAKDVTIEVLTPQNLTFEPADDSIKQVYYLPQEYSYILKEGYWNSDNEENKQKLQQLKDKSVLIWEKEES